MIYYNENNLSDHYYFTFLSLPSEKLGTHSRILAIFMDKNWSLKVKLF